MLFNCPLHFEKADRLIAQLGLELGGRVADVGCGNGEFLIRVAEQYEISGVGFDNNPELIQEANAAAEARKKSASVSFQTRDLSVYEWDGDKFEAIVCIGAEFIFGGYEAMLRTLSSALKTNGRLLVGTIFWKKEPSFEYLQLMNGENSHFDHATTVEIARKHGFVPLYVCRSSDDEWDEFESRVSQKRYLEALLQPKIEEKLSRIEKWQNGYLRWGTATMGFGFYILHKG